MRHRTVRGAVIAALFALGLSPLCAQPADSFDDLVQRARFIFIGDVVKLGSSTMASVPPTGKTAVVRVSDVLTGEALFGGFRGREITVELLQPERYEKTLFFTNIVVYGKSLAAVEIAHQPAGRSPETLRKEIAAAEDRNRDRAILARIARASLVVSGRVTEVRPPKGGIPQSEHDPRWAVALVSIEEVLKGQASGMVNVIFPTSDDEMWSDSPKFAPGVTGIWILQSDQKEKGFPKLRVPGLTALDPLDFHPPSALPHIRELVARQQ